MDKMLHRGEYKIKEDEVIGDKVPLKGWKMLGMGKEFTKGDKIIYIAAYTWTFLWVVVFIIGTIFNLTTNVSDKSWMNFWEVFILIYVGASAIIVVWFTIGGFRDFKEMIHSLNIWFVIILMTEPLNMTIENQKTNIKEIKSGEEL